MDWTLPDVAKYDGAFWNAISLVFIFFHHAMGNSKREHVLPTQTLLDDCMNVRQPLCILKIREAIGAYDGPELGLGLSLHFWEKCHCEEECLEGGEALVQ